MSEDYSAIIASGFAEFGLSLSLTAHEKLARYCHELGRWAQKINLTSLHGRALVQRLILEPAWIAADLQISGSVVDIGSGNGSPSIPIQCTRDLDAMHLVEARARRAAFLRHLSTVLELKNTQVHRALFQDAVLEIPPMDCVTLQAVTPTPELLESVRKIAKPSTRIVWLTSRDLAGLHFAEAEKRKVPFGNTTAIIFRAS